MKLIKIFIYVAIFVLIALLTQAQHPQVKMGFNPIKIAPTSALEVEAANGKKVIVDKAKGSLCIQNMPMANATSEVSVVVVDGTTGELQVAAQVPITKSFTVIRYFFKNLQHDFIANFDTKIPANEYTVGVIGASFSKMLTNTSGKRLNFQVNSSGTWNLNADYRLVQTFDLLSGEWMIDVLVMNKDICDYKGALTFSMAGLTEGAALTKPDGL